MSYGRYGDDATDATNAGTFVGAVVDVFGRAIHPPVTPVVPVTTGLPLWVWILIPVAGVAAIGILRRRKKS